MVRLGQKEVARVEGNCLKYLKRGWNRKEGKGNKDFKRRGEQAGPRGGSLKKITNYGYIPPSHFYEQTLTIK